MRLFTTIKPANKFIIATGEFFMAQAQEKAQPLFFKNPAPIQLEKHAKAGLAVDGDFKFAKLTNSSPINVQEFALIAKSYPIVFTGDAAAVPVAVLGLENSRNVFINDKNHWEKNCYIPAYVRQYPFGLSVDGDKLTLCIDESSDKFKKNASDKDMKFFSGKEPGDVIKSALEFCASYYNDSKITAGFSAEMQQNGMFIERQINVSLNGRNKPIVLGGFKVIDDSKLNNLSDELILKWHKNGYLALIHFHILSLTNLQALVNRLPVK